MLGLSASEFTEQVGPLLTGALVQQGNAGPGTGSIFTLHLAQAQATSYLMVFCSWKLLQAGTLSCSWKDAEITIAAALTGLTGLRLRHLQVDPGGDAVLEWDQGLRLCLFSDSAVPADPAVESDYFVEVGNTIYTCLRGHFYVEQNKP